MRPVTYLRLLGLIAAGFAGAPLLEAQAPLAPQPRLLESYGRLPLHFERNEGQADPRVTFLARGSGYSLFLTPAEAVLALTDRADHAPAVLRMKLAGANPSPHVTGRDELPGKINYFVGNDSARWRTNIATYARVHYRAVYPGIDLVYYGNQRQLEYDFVVAPGADPGRIRMSFDGARDVRIDANGDLILQAAGGDLRQHTPLVYQDVHGVRQPIAGRYAMKGSLVGFELGAYDKARPLVIDPILVYSTYLGGASSDEGHDIEVDAAGNAYVTGQTNSAAFPTTPGAFDTSLSGANLDVFVTKLNATGSTLIYSTYLGSIGTDVGNGVAVDAAGQAYVVGATQSDNFPTTAGAFDRARSGQDAFVTKLNATGNLLVYSTFLGGGQADLANDVVLDSAGNASVTGQTLSSSDDPPNAFPTTPGAFQPAYGGAGDAFVTRLNLTGTGLVYSTYVGGSGLEIGSGIALEAGGTTYVTGETQSANFPTTPSAFDTSLGGTSDAFVAKLTLAGSGPSDLLYSTYLGGSGTESGNDIAVDAFFKAHVTGPTTSVDFPTTPGALQTTYGGGTDDAFVTTVSESGGALFASTYLGGSAGDHATGIAVATAGSVSVTGVTSSGNFPVTPDAVYPTFGGVADAFVTTLDTSGSALIDSTYLGGSEADSGNAIALDLAGNAYVTGSTGSDSFPTTAGAYDPIFNGASDAFIAKIEYARVPAVVTLDPLEDTNPVNSGHCVTATVTDAAGNPVSGVTVRFRVIGAANTSGSATTDESGKAVFCYTGPITPGADAIRAFADIDKDDTEDANEPGGGATKLWVAGPPATLTLTPAAATNPVGAQHCVTATVRDGYGNATPGITVRFNVTGAVSTSGSTTTDVNGAGAFCYTGPTTPGADAISAFADTDGDGAQGALEPGAGATKTWVPGAPATLTLTPAAATNPVGAQHCVAATVRDTFGNATPGITVRFNVTGAVNTSGTARTGGTGQGVFCYTGPTAPGADAISAYADADEDGTPDVGEPGGGAAKAWVPGAPATLTLTPPTASNPIGTQHCVTAIVKDAFGNATPGITVQFWVSGAVTTNGSAATDASGEADFCYAGPPVPGADTITAYADSDNDGGQDAGEPAGTAVKTWLAATAAECKVTGGGYITTVTGGRAIFAGHAWSQDGKTGGMQAYYDRGRDPRVSVNSLNVLGVVCRSATEATIFGQALVNGSTRVDYRIEVKDMGEPGHGRDTYSITLSNGYTSGEQVLKGGNIQIH